MPKPNRCEVCGEPTEKPVNWCRACRSSYDRAAHQDGSCMEAILWAARRARWYAERRAARNARTSVDRERVRVSCSDGIKIASVVSDPPVFTDEDLARMQLESDRLHEAFKSRRRS